jgi:hypothetical protein
MVSAFDLGFRSISCNTKDLVQIFVRDKLIYFWIIPLVHFEKIKEHATMTDALGR